MQKYTKFLKFLPTAKTAATYSKDPSTKVGAIAIDDDYNIRAQGYNGFPRGVNDTEERLNDREQKYPRIVHAEANLVAMAARTGASLQGCSVLLTSLHPCSSCAGLLIQAGIKRVIAPENTDNSRWDSSAQVALEMFKEAGVELVYYDTEGVVSCVVGDDIRNYKKAPKYEVPKYLKPRFTAEETRSLLDQMRWEGGKGEIFKIEFPKPKLSTSPKEVLDYMRKVVNTVLPTLRYKVQLNKFSLKGENARVFLGVDPQGVPFQIVNQFGRTLIRKSKGDHLYQTWFDWSRLHPEDADVEKETEHLTSLIKELESLRDSLNGVRGSKDFMLSEALAILQKVGKENDY